MTLAGSKMFLIICKKKNQRFRNYRQRLFFCPHRIVDASSEQQRPTDPEIAANRQHMCIYAFIKCTDVQNSTKKMTFFAVYRCQTKQKETLHVILSDCVTAAVVFTFFVFVSL